MTSNRDAASHQQTSWQLLERFLERVAGLSGGRDEAREASG